MERKREDKKTDEQQDKRLIDLNKVRIAISTCPSQALDQGGASKILEWLFAGDFDAKED